MRYIALAFAVFAVACGSDSGPSSVVGTYAITTVNGQPLPAQLVKIDATGQTWYQMSGTMEINTDGTWTLLYPQQFRSGPITGMASPAPFDSGTYVRSGSTITFTDITSGSLPFHGVVSGSTMTMNDEMLNEGIPARTPITFTRQ